VISQKNCILGYEFKNSENLKASLWIFILCDSYLRTLLTGFKESIVSERHPVYDKVARVANQILRGNRDLRQIYDKVGESRQSNPTRQQRFETNL
jgi:hypothetical protein